MSTRKGKAPDTANIRGSKTSNFCNLNRQYNPKSDHFSSSVGAFPQNFRQNIIEHLGHGPESIDDSGRLQRFSSNGKKDDQSGWYVFFLHGDFAAGAFGCWRKYGYERILWNSRNGNGRLPPAQWQQVSKVLAKAGQQVKAEQQQKAAQGQRKAAQMWQSAHDPDPAHPYLRRKQVGAYGIRQSGNVLLIPVCDTDGQLYGLQTIDADGVKRFLSGTAKRGHFCLIGQRLVHSAGVYLCEGYATGASLYEAYHQPVLVAFDSGNLLSVCRAYKQDYPHIPLTVCADNDRGREGNPGLTKAREVCVVFPDVGLIVPEFPEDAPADNYSDFNDLTVLLRSNAQKDFAL